MSDLHVYEYALLHVVPRIERGERVNAGVLVYCRPLSYVGARTHLDEARLLALDPAADVDGVRAAGEVEPRRASVLMHPPFPRARAGPRRPRPVRRCQVARRGRVPGTDTRTTGASSRPDDRAGPVPPCVRVTLRRAARRTGTRPQARGICPERPPTLR